MLSTRTLTHSSAAWGRALIPATVDIGVVTTEWLSVQLVHNDCHQQWKIAERRGVINYQYKGIAPTFVVCVLISTALWKCYGLYDLQLYVLQPFDMSAEWGTGAYQSSCGTLYTAGVRFKAQWHSLLLSLFIITSCTPCVLYSFFPFSSIPSSPSIYSPFINLFHTFSFPSLPLSIVGTMRVCLYHTSCRRLLFAHYTFVGVTQWDENWWMCEEWYW